MNEFDSYSEWLAIPDGPRPPGHYELLGLDPGESDPARIKAASLERSAKVRRYCLGQHGAEATRLLGELAAAFACLSDPTAKAAYDRQLYGDDEVADDSAPPQRHDDESFDDEAPPPKAKAGLEKTRTAPRSFVWLKRPRSSFAPGPAHFVLTALLLLVATCAVVWSARRPTPNDGPQHADVAVAVAPSIAPTLNKPAEAAPSPASSTANDQTTPSLPKPEVTNKSTADGSPRGDTKPKDEAGARDEVSPAGAADEGHAADDTASTPSPAASEDLDPFFGPSSPSAKKADLAATDSKPAENEQSADEISGKSRGPAVAQENARVLPPGAVWRLSTGDEPELMEVTFDSPVDVAHVDLLEPAQPAMIERAVIEFADGSATELRPVAVPGFFHDGIRRWSFGATRRARTSRFLLRFRPTEDGYVELAGLEVLDRMGKPQPLMLVRAVSETADHPNVEQPDALGQFDEVAAQSLLDKAKKQPTVTAYAGVLKNYPQTSAAVEAVRGLAEIIVTVPRSGTASSARKALDRLVVHFPDSAAAKEVPAALREATPASLPPEPKPNQFRLPDGPPGRRGPGPRLPGPPFR